MAFQAIVDGHFTLIKLKLLCAFKEQILLIVQQGNSTMPSSAAPSYRPPQAAPVLTCSPSLSSIIKNIP